MDNSFLTSFWSQTLALPNFPKFLLLLRPADFFLKSISYCFDLEFKIAGERILTPSRISDLLTSFWSQAPFRRYKSNSFPNHFSRLHAMFSERFLLTSFWSQFHIASIYLLTSFWSQTSPLSIRNSFTNPISLAHLKCCDPLTHSAAPSPAFQGGVKKRLSGSTLSNPRPSGRKVEGLTSFWSQFILPVAGPTQSKPVKLDKSI